MCDGSRQSRAISPATMCGLAVGGMWSKRTPLVQTVASFSRTSSPSESTMTLALTNGISTSSVRSKESAQASPATNRQIQRTIITLSERSTEGIRPRKPFIANPPRPGWIDARIRTSMELAGEIDPSACRYEMYRCTFGIDHCRETAGHARMRACPGERPRHKYVGVC
mgnify:CR=1 FL=1